MHYHCFANFRRRQNLCPTCRIGWPEDHTDNTFIPIGEGAAREGDDARRWSRNEASDGDDEEEHWDEEEPDTTQSQPYSQRKTQRTKKTKAVQDNSMDIDEEDYVEPVKRERASQPTRRSRRK